MIFSRPRFLRYLPKGLPATLKGLAACTGFVLMLAACGTTSKSSEVSMVETEMLRYPQIVEEPILEAYRHYPELHSNKVSFIIDSEFKGAFMQAQPVIGSLWKPMSNREYKIRMKPHFVLDGDTIPIQDLPHRALVGWFGHELGHLMDYSERNSLNMTWFGLRYLMSEKAVVIAERTADHHALKHGLGKEIIATKEFIMKKGTFPAWYTKKIKKLYLTAEEVRQLAEEEGINLDEDS